jgi:hypothetical protein
LDAAKSGDQSAQLAIVGGDRVSRVRESLVPDQRIGNVYECLLYGLLVIFPPT